MLKLSIQDSEGRSTVVPLSSGELSIGRDKANVICLTDRNVSRWHARLIVRDESVTLDNVAATYGTRLNNLLIRESTEIVEGDTVEIGDYKLTLQSDTPRETALRDPANGNTASGTLSKGRGADGATAMVNLADLQSALAESAAATQLPESQQPRLIVESENLRGLELRVTRSPTVIGRVADNADLVVEHRSISKEHARLTRLADGTWQILDLGSANGLRVGGEAYSKCAVGHNDRIELGHVTLRFELPGGAPAAASDSPLANKRLLIALALLAVLVVVGLLALVRSNGKPADAEPKEQGASPVASPAGQAAAESEQKSAAAKPAVDEPASARPAAAPGSLEAALDKVNALYAAGLFAEAREAAAAAVVQFPGKAQAEAASQKVAVALEVQATLDKARSMLSTAPAEAVALATAAQGRIDEAAPKSLRDAAAQVIADGNVALEAARSGRAAAGAVARPAPGGPVSGTAAAPARARDPAAQPGSTAPDAKEAAPVVPRPAGAENTGKPEPAAKSESTGTTDGTGKPTPDAAPKPAELYKSARDKVLAGDEDGGIALYKQAAAAGYRRAHGPLAKLYMQRGDKASCARHAKAYLDAYPDAGDAAQMQTLLEKCQ